MVVQDLGNYVILMYGLAAFDRLQVSPLITAPTSHLHAQQAQEHLSSKGLRVLALCRGEIDDSEDVSGLNPETLRKRKPTLAFVALLAILDPPREEVISAVKVAHTAGICVKMITGRCGSGRYFPSLFTHFSHTPHLP